MLSCTKRGNTTDGKRRFSRGSLDVSTLWLILALRMQQFTAAWVSNVVFQQQVSNLPVNMVNVHKGVLVEW